MQSSDLSILQNVDVRERTSAATVAVLQQRANPAPRTTRFLSDEHYILLDQIVRSTLPQDAIGTTVDIADSIDRRLEANTGSGWRYAELPPDREAYRQGLTIFSNMLQQTPMKLFSAMPPPAREGYLRCVANGDVDTAAGFPLGRWLKVLRTEIIRTWVSHPEGMAAMGYFGFADGATGNEGWTSIGPNTAAPFEYEGNGEQIGRTENGGLSTQQEDLIAVAGEQ